MAAPYRAPLTQSVGLRGQATDSGTAEDPGQLQHVLNTSRRPAPADLRGSCARSSHTAENALSLPDVMFHRQKRSTVRPESAQACSSATRICHMRTRGPGTRTGLSDSLVFEIVDIVKVRQLEQPARGKAANSTAFRSARPRDPVVPVHPEMEQRERRRETSPLAFHRHRKIFVRDPPPTRGLACSLLLAIRTAYCPSSAIR